MHSSGRGEESSDAYRGVVLPSGQQQPAYGEQVQPAAGTPWGTPVQQPEPADATQMLPPYPAGVPGDMPGMPPVAQQPPAVPVADATQMLPPYPGGDPGAGFGMPPQPGGVPPIPPQAPEPAAAEATQAMPLMFPDQHGGPGYEQPGGYHQPGGFEQQGGFERQGGYEQQPYDGSGQSFGDGQDPYGTAYQGDGYEQPSQPGSDYDHLFRNDVPSPAPMRPRIIQPPGQQPGQPYAQAGQPPYGRQPGGYDQGYDNGYGYDDGGDDGRRKMSPKVLIGIVVAGCVVAGLVVGGLLNSGGSASADNTSPTASATPSTGATASSGAAADPAKQQAVALDSLLGTSGASRSSVVRAVESIKGCDNLPGAATDLRTAASQRQTLITKLAALPVDKLPDHSALTDALTKAWRASSAADTHYATWADQAEHNRKVCRGGHARGTQETQLGDRESGTATIEKKKAVKLWNTIADRYGLTKRQYSQL